MNLGKKVIYQIYPKSFYDSNGDGIGDLRGIIEKIPYIAKLNIDMIWFNPFFVSPQHDNGYDIANYREIDPSFGTMADFEELVAKLKEINVDVMLDMVFNHCSTDHEWFKKALAGDEKYMKYFYIRPAKPNTIFTCLIRLKPILTGIIQMSAKKPLTSSISGGQKGLKVSALMY